MARSPHSVILSGKALFTFIDANLLIRFMFGLPQAKRTKVKTTAPFFFGDETKTSKAVKMLTYWMKIN